MLLILDRYLLSEVLKSFAKILIILVLIIGSQIFIRYLDKVATGVVAHDVLSIMIGLEMSKELGNFIPPAFFFAILSTMGRMYKDSEMTALFASGVSQMRVFISFAWLIIPLMLLSAWLMMSVTPWAKQYLQEYKEEQKDTADIVNLSAGKFNESNKGDLVFYMEELNETRTEMSNIFVQHRKNGKLGLVKADKGYQYVDEKSGDTFIVMLNGFRFEGNPGEYAYTVTRFEKYAVRIDKARNQQILMTSSIKPTMDLLRDNSRWDQVEFQKRLAAPLSILVFAILSIPLSKSSPRKGMAGRIILAILIYFIYFNLQAVSGGWMYKGVTPLWLGRWWVHLVMLVIAAYLIMRNTLAYAAFVQSLKAKLLRRPA